MTSRQDWLAHGMDAGWTAPAVARWKRWPMIRHVRTIVYGLAQILVEEEWESIGFVSGGYAEWLTYGRWRGWEASA